MTQINDFHYPQNFPHENPDSIGNMKSSSERLRSNSYEVSATKRIRAGSISGRLRAASDLEESGLINKHQKGLIKDLIISGDATVQQLLDKFEKGNSQELLDFIRAGYLAKQNIDIIDTLDFDFLSNFPVEDDMEDFHTHMVYPPQPSQHALPPHPPPAPAEPMRIHNNQAPQFSHPSFKPDGGNNYNQRVRKESIDALYLQELLQDVDNVPGGSSGLGDADDFGQIFHQFASEEALLAQQPQHGGGRPSHRKSLRIDHSMGPP
eukprot:gene35841-43469_t